MSTVDAIKKLHTSVIDTRRAYETAEVETNDAGLKLFFSSMIALRQKDHDQLHHFARLGPASIIERMRAAIASIANGLVNTAMPGVRCRLPRMAFSA